jgi:hypothetical protein
MLLVIAFRLTQSPDDSSMAIWKDQLYGPRYDGATYELTMPLSLRKRDQLPASWTGQSVAMIFPYSDEMQRPKESRIA